jgi:hypothetical protein
MTLHGIVTVAIVAMVAIVVIDFTRSYAASGNTGWQRLLDAGRGSATILWSQLGFVIAGMLTAFDQLADLVCQLTGAPGADDAFKQAIQSYFTTTTVGTVLAIYAVITVLARVRTLNKK